MTTLDTFSVPIWDGCRRGLLFKGTSDCENEKIGDGRKGFTRV